MQVFKTAYVTRFLVVNRLAIDSFDLKPVTYSAVEPLHLCSGRFLISMTFNLFWEKPFGEAGPVHTPASHVGMFQLCSMGHLPSKSAFSILDS